MRCPTHKDCPSCSETGGVVMSRPAVPKTAAPGVAATPTSSGAFPEGNDGDTGAAALPERVVTGWAATNTLREALDKLRDSIGVEDEEDAALALVEAALDAAEGVMTQVDYETPHHTRLRAALRAVREGA